MKKIQVTGRDAKNNTQTRRILLADNDSAAASMLYVYFGNRGYDVERMGTVTGLIDKVLDNDNRTVIIDADFCGEETYNLLRIIKRIDSGMKIILTSGKIGVSALARAREAGIFFHAVKPFNFDEIETAVIQAEKKGGG